VNGSDAELRCDGIHAQLLLSHIAREPCAADPVHKGIFIRTSRNAQWPSRPETNSNLCAPAKLGAFSPGVDFLKAFSAAHDKLIED
jgi:hypothetical protein